ncbi:hypothetical protein SAMN05216276_10822 [Streptosporangium subroseum]|uniref:Dolichyl-phosphate-mannose-protein mannosyltransferase n=1 Tax=Streptosporangium subroseum TaxID=106412 RepID=A0A239P1W5_9ACTN|nr:hypothetical protein [Streptosporangium subroseum]SNT61111.1 hypothetical protein SAMN05216276_10822 [Streptosporangium subroseum]
MVTAAELPRLDEPSAARITRLWAFLRRHRLFVAFLALAFALRLVTMLGYGPALWFNDSYEYVSGAVNPDRPSALRPNGYSFWLLLLRPLHSFALVTFLQHLMGLGIAVLVYALLRKKFGLPGWGATLAAVPVLFDAYQIQLEHLIMSDTMFMLLVVGVITLVLWHRKMSWRLGAVVGLLLALTALTRSIGLPILALVVVYMLVKRTGWKTITAMVTACALPVLGYMVWFASAHGNFAMTNSDGAILYMRTALFADCKKMGIDPRKELELALLCISDPPSERDFGQKYLWWAQNGQRFHAFGVGSTFTPEMNQAAGTFAKRAILSQPLDYLSIVAVDFFRAFHWGRPRFPDFNTYRQYEFLPENKILPVWASNRGSTDTDALKYDPGLRTTLIPGKPRSSVIGTDVHDPWAVFMQGYQRVIRLPGIVIGALLLIGLAGVAVRWRKMGGPLLLPWLASFGLILAPAATAEFDYRYLLPAVPLACMAAAIALRRGFTRSGSLAAPGALPTPGSAADTDPPADTGSHPAPSPLPEPSPLPVAGSTTAPDPLPASDPLPAPGSAADTGPLPASGSAADPGFLPSSGSMTGPGFLPVPGSVTVPGSPAPAGRPGSPALPGSSIRPSSETAFASTTASAE